VIQLADIEAARDRLGGSVVRTPLIRLELEDAPAEIYLKLENLQPIGSFKIRGAGNALLLASPEDLAQGVWTASAGNMAQGVAWWARKLGVRCTVVLPDTAPQTKIDAIRRLGGEMVEVTFDEWHEVFRTRTFEGLDGLHVHAFSDDMVMAGNGTIALEILEDLPDVDCILAPYGGGGLSCGIASAIRGVAPSCKVFAAEVATGAPFAASLEAGEPVKVEYTPTFVDGIGGPEVFEEMFELAQELLDGSLVATLDEVTDAVRLLAGRARVVAEGAGATPVALARNGAAGSGKVVCIVSGGNIDGARLAEILGSRTPLTAG
jgi:threonine dehydratase